MEANDVKRDYGKIVCEKPKQSEASSTLIEETQDLKFLRNAVVRLFAILDDFEQYEATEPDNEKLRAMVKRRGAQRYWVSDLVEVDGELYKKKRKTTQRKP